MTIYYERFAVYLIQNSDGFRSSRDYYRAWFGAFRNDGDLVGMGLNREDAALDLLRKVTERQSK